MMVKPIKTGEAWGRKLAEIASLQKRPMDDIVEAEVIDYAAGETPDEEGEEEDDTVEDVLGFMIYASGRVQGGDADYFYPLDLDGQGLGKIFEEEEYAIMALEQFRIDHLLASQRVGGKGKITSNDDFCIKQIVGDGDGTVLGNIPLHISQDTVIEALCNKAEEEGDSCTS